MPRRPWSLRKPDLSVGHWTISRLLARSSIEGKGPYAECDGTCCLHGVNASLGERDRILQYADRIKQVMDDTQTKDTGRWFDEKLGEDDDYPGGLCVGTATYRDKCVFLNGDAKCVLQLLEPELDLPEGEHLKPWFCFLFPISSSGGLLEFDPMNDGDRPCCSLAANGQGTPTVDAFEFEFRMVLGAEGYESLRRTVLGGTEAALVEG